MLCQSARSETPALKKKILRKRILQQNYFCLSIRGLGCVQFTKMQRKLVSRDTALLESPPINYNFIYSLIKFNNDLLITITYFGRRHAATVH